MVMDRFKRGEKPSARKMNALRAGILQGPGIISIGTGNFQRQLAQQQQQQQSASYLAYCKANAGTGDTIECYMGNPWPEAWVDTASYAAGKIVCLNKTEKVYVSLLGSNTNQNPATATTYWTRILNWNNTTIYAADDLVFGLDGVIYKSLQADNENHLITEAAWWEAEGVWDDETTYALGDICFGSDGYLYTSLDADNIGNDPTTSLTKWQVFASITVTCKIYEDGSNLQYCTPLLATHDEMKIQYIDGLWRSLTTFSVVCGGEA